MAGRYDADDRCNDTLQAGASASDTQTRPTLEQLIESSNTESSRFVSPTLQQESRSILPSAQPVVPAARSLNAPGARLGYKLKSGETKLMASEPLPTSASRQQSHVTMTGNVAKLNSTPAQFTPDAYVEKPCRPYVPSVPQNECIRSETLNVLDAWSWEPEEVVETNNVVDLFASEAANMILDLDQQVNEAAEVEVLSGLDQATENPSPPAVILDLEQQASESSSTLAMRGLDQVTENQNPSPPAEVILDLDQQASEIANVEETPSLDQAETVPATDLIIALLSEPELNDSTFSGLQSFYRMNRHNPVVELESGIVAFVYVDTPGSLLVFTGNTRDLCLFPADDDAMEGNLTIEKIFECEKFDAGEFTVNCKSGHEIAPSIAGRKMFADLEFKTFDSVERAATYQMKKKWK